MTLTGAQLARIHQAILPAYIRDELRRVISAGMNVEFSHHVSPEKAYSDQIFEFVTWADWQGRALELLRCAAEGNERNTGLQALWAEAQGWDALVQPAKTTEPSASPATPHHVFLAYSRKDSEVMRQIHTDPTMDGKTKRATALARSGNLAHQLLHERVCRWRVVPLRLRATGCLVLLQTDNRLSLHRSHLRRR